MATIMVRSLRPSSDYDHDQRSDLARVLCAADVVNARGARIRYVAFDNNDVTTVNAALGVPQ